LRKNNGAQDFAALDLGGLFLLLRRLGMEWAPSLARVDMRRDCSERAMIRDRDPRANRNRDNYPSQARFHIAAFESADSR
jgi:hypothetical protein